MRDLMDHDPDFSLNDVHLLKVGRHFRFSPAVKLVVGRSEQENLKIQRGIDVVGPDNVAAIYGQQTKRSLHRRLLHSLISPNSMASYETHQLLWVMILMIS
jgi:hypothetical protein